MAGVLGNSHLCMCTSHSYIAKLAASHYIYLSAVWCWAGTVQWVYQLKAAACYG